MSSDAFSLQSSLLMWALSALIVLLGAHVMLGWMRQAQEEWEWDLGRLRQVGIGAATFGTALSIAIPVGLAGEALGFPLGYHPLAALGLWLGTIIVITLLALVPVWREEGASAAGAGLLLGLLLTGLQLAWILAAGFRPGIRWNPIFIGAAAVVSAAGTSTAMALAFPYGQRARNYRYSWRIAAAGLIGLSFLAGYALLLYAADMNTQIGSIYRYELPGSMLSLLGGALLPVVLLLMVMDLEARRKQRRRQWRSRRRGETGLGDSAMAADTEASRFMLQGPSSHTSGYAHRRGPRDGVPTPTPAPAPAPGPPPEGAAPAHAGPGSGQTSGDAPASNVR